MLLLLTFPSHRAILYSKEHTFVLLNQGESVMKYFIRIDNETVFVTEEIYKAYCQGQRKERYFRESDIQDGLLQRPGYRRNKRLRSLL